MLERVWRLEGLRASSLQPCAAVLYGFGEHPFRRWGRRRSSVFQQLLGAGFTPRLALALREVAPERVGHFEQLVASGWGRFGTSLSGGVFRVVAVQRAGERLQHLSPREFGVAELAARGWKSQRIGAELAIAAPTARGAIDRCVQRLDLTASVQLPLLWHTLGSPGRSFIGASGSRYQLRETPLSRLTERLTNAERAVVERLLAGDTQRAMADHRGVSVRTVANQMSRLFRKYGAASRTELVARLLELGGEG